MGLRQCTQCAIVPLADFLCLLQAVILLIFEVPFFPIKEKGGKKHPKVVPCAQKGLLCW